jgi:predicted helicase
MMAPYAIAHMKIALKLHETGYSFASRERARVFLTNALEGAGDANSKVKFTVIIGNPPYSGHSANSGKFANALVDDFFLVDGKRIKEANAKWLRDDYAKFLALGKRIVAEAGAGVLGFITNHSYIAAPIFRGLRWQFMRGFDDIRIVDLHGNLKLADQSVAARDDENVFDIQQGVAIMFASRTTVAASSSVVRYGELVGPRAKKLEALMRAEPDDNDCRAVRPLAPFYLFSPEDDRRRAEFQNCRALASLFPDHSLGVLTKRDRLAIAFSRRELLEQLSIFADRRISDRRVAVRFDLPAHDKDGWNLKGARRKFEIRNASIRPILYRPFDYRYICYDETIVARVNRRVMSRLLSPRAPAGLIAGRQGAATGSAKWDVCFVANGLVDQNIFRRGGGTVFALPLNLSESEQTPPTCSADQTPAYCYAVLHAPSYRARFRKQLGTDFPRLPRALSPRLAEALRGFGSRLIALHLLDAKAEKALADPHHVRFAGHGAARVEREYPRFENGRVLINSGRWFEEVSEATWAFGIGGYQVSARWLRARRERVLSVAEILHYRRVVHALSETIRLMTEIDCAIEGHGGWPDAFEVMA